MNEVEYRRGPTVQDNPRQQKMVISHRFIGVGLMSSWVSVSPVLQAQIQGAGWVIDYKTYGLESCQRWRNSKFNDNYKYTLDELRK